MTKAAAAPLAKCKKKCKECSCCYTIYNGCDEVRSQKTNDEVRVLATLSDAGATLGVSEETTTGPIASKRTRTVYKGQTTAFIFFAACNPVV